MARRRGRRGKLSDKQRKFLFAAGVLGLAGGAAAFGVNVAKFAKFKGSFKHRFNKAPFSNKALVAQIGLTAAGGGALELSRGRNPITGKRFGKKSRFHVKSIRSRTKGLFNRKKRRRKKR